MRLEQRPKAGQISYFYFSVPAQGDLQGTMRGWSWAPASRRHCHTRITPYQSNHTAALATLPCTTPGVSIRIPSRPLPIAACGRLTPKNAIVKGSRANPSQALDAGNDDDHSMNQLQASMAVGHQ